MFSPEYDLFAEITLLLPERAGRNNGSLTDPDGFIGYGNGSGRSFISDGLTILSQPLQEEPRA